MIFVSYVYLTEDGNYGFGNAQINKAIDNIQDVMSVELLLKEKFNNENSIKLKERGLTIISFQKF